VLATRSDFMSDAPAGSSLRGHFAGEKRRIQPWNILLFSGT
jgi:hypothetical protein